MAVHPKLIHFFEGAHAGLLAAYKRSMGSSTACMGSLREHGIRDALRHTLPALAPIYEGEIIDTFGGQSGQLDGIVVHGSGAALGGSEREPRVVLAEGVLGVIESKSDIGSQWERVKETWKRVRDLRRSVDPQAAAFLRGSSQQPDSWSSIPFVAVGYHGWKTKETLAAKLAELEGVFLESGRPREEQPPTAIFQLDPPGFAAYYSRGGTLQAAYNFCEPWRVVALLWSTFTYNAQAFEVLPVNFAGYIKPAS